MENQINSKFKFGDNVYLSVKFEDSYYSALGIILKVYDRERYFIKITSPTKNFPKKYLKGWKRLGVKNDEGLFYGNHNTGDWTLSRLDSNLTFVSRETYYIDTIKYITQASLGRTGKTKTSSSKISIFTQSSQNDGARGIYLYIHELDVGAQYYYNSNKESDENALKVAYELAKYNWLSYIFKKEKLINNVHTN